MPHRSLRKTIALLAVLLLAGCAGAPPAGTPEYAAWVKQKQEQAASIEYHGSSADSLRFFRSSTP